MDVLPGLRSATDLEDEPHPKCLPNAAYGLEDGFDPKRYHFYNPPSQRDTVSIGLDHEIDPNSRSSTKASRQNTGKPAKEHRSLGPSSSLQPIEERDDEKRAPQCPPDPPSPSETEFVQDVSAPAIVDRPNAEDEHGELLSLEKRFEMLFSREHLQSVLTDIASTAKFERFLRARRPDSVAMLNYYHGIAKVLSSMHYAKGVAQELRPVQKHDFTLEAIGSTLGFTWLLQDKANRALDVLMGDFPDFIYDVYMRIVYTALLDKMVGIQSFVFQDVIGGLAEAFVIADPAKEDNPIVFSSDGFHEMTGYSRKEFLGRNCRILGGDGTSVAAVRRFKASLDAQREHCEALLNYRKDGSAFINLVMSIPLHDQTGRLRYHLGSQLDISSLINKASGLGSFRDLVSKEEKLLGQSIKNQQLDETDKDDFDKLIETFNGEEMEKLVQFERRKALLPEGIFPKQEMRKEDSLPSRPSSESRDIRADDVRLQTFSGFYPNYVLVRPYPSLRVLFASSDLRTDNVLQKPVSSLISGSPRVINNLAYALQTGRKVTAQVEFSFSPQERPRSMWIHCTPLSDASASLSVWIMVLVETDGSVVNDVDDLEPRTSSTSKPQQIRKIEATPWELVAAQEESRGISKAKESAFDPHASDKEQELSEPLQMTGPGPNPRPRIAGKLYAPNNPGDERWKIHTRGSRSGSEPAFGHKDPPFATANGIDSQRSTNLTSLPIRGSKIQDEKTEDQTKTSGLPLSRRTYKSLSPYGVLFDE